MAKGLKSTCPTIISQPQITSETDTTSSYDQFNFSVSFFKNACPYPLFSSSNMAHLSSHYMASLLKVLQIPDPCSYAQITKQHLEWVKAMDQ